MILTSRTGVRTWIGRLVFVLTLGALACGGSEPAVTDAVELEEPAPVVETRWTTRSELFVEYPPLVEGETSRFAIHFTDLATFEPVRAGRASVRLTACKIRSSWWKRGVVPGSSVWTSGRTKPVAIGSKWCWTLQN